MTCASVNYFYYLLKFLLPGYELHSLHGKSSARKRPKLLQQFKEMKSGVLMTTDLVARGVDFPTNPVDWIIQFDPPQNPAFFIHRVGRTARNGADGNALVFLLPTEEAYIDFLAQKDIPINEMELALNLPDISEDLKVKIRKDRKIFELGEKGFVSYIRAYKEHHCNYIFSIKELPLLDILNLFVLLRIPKVPDVPMAHLESLFNSETTEHIPYADKSKERQRQKKIRRKNKVVTPRQKKAKDARLKFGKAAKDQKKKIQRAMSLERNRLETQRKDQQQRILEQRAQQMDEDEITKDYLLIQNLRKRKLSQQQFDESFGNEEESSNKIQRTSTEYESEEEEEVETENSEHSENSELRIPNNNNNKKQPKKKKKWNRRQKIHDKRAKKARKDNEKAQRELSLKKASGSGTASVENSVGTELIRSQSENIIATKKPYVPPPWKKRDKISKYQPGMKNTDKYNKNKSKNPTEKKN